MTDAEPDAEPGAAGAAGGGAGGGQAATGETVRRRLHVSGRVQGVFYRENLRRLAVEKGVGGWAKNVRDGLDAVLEGPRPVVDDLIKWCRTGPPHAVVIHVGVEDEEPTGETEFRVR